MKLLPRRRHPDARVEAARKFALHTSVAFEDGKMVLKESQDVEPYLERNKRERLAGRGPYGDGLVRCARVPNVVYHKFMREWGIEPSRWFDADVQERVIRTLNSNEYRDLRVVDGKI